MKVFLLMASVLCFSFSAQSETTESTVMHVDAPAAAKLLTHEPKPIVLDVRTVEEFASGHLAGAKNIDFKKNNFAAKLEKLDKSKAYLVHCRSGQRSTKALAILKKLGFEKIYHLDGGYLGWEKFEAAKK